MKPSRKIPQKLKINLLEAAGNKCSNPGCFNTIIEYHHIREWAVVKSHNEHDMIAVCPACHDAAHRGELRISEKTLYEWKGINRSLSAPKRGYVYVEPSNQTKIIMGSMAFEQAKPRKTILFSHSEESHLSFTVEDDTLEISTTITDHHRNKLISVNRNHTTDFSMGRLKTLSIPGRFKVTAPVDLWLLPAHALFKIRKEEPDYAQDDIVTVLDIEVLRPGHVRIEGFWNKGFNTIVSTKERLSFIDLHSATAQSITGEGENSILVYDGPIEQALFSLR